MRKLLKYVAILLVGTLLPTNKVYPQDNEEEWGADINDLKTAFMDLEKPIGWLDKEIPIYQCNHQWLKDSLCKYANQYKQLYPALEEEFGKRDTFMIDIAEDRNYKDFYKLRFYMKLWNGFEAIRNRNGVYTFYEMDEVVGCIQTDTVFFMLMGSPSTTVYFKKTKYTYKQTYLIVANRLIMDARYVWWLYLYKEPKTGAIINTIYYRED